MVDIMQNPKLSNSALNELFLRSWPDYKERDFKPVLERSLAYFGGFSGATLISYLNVAWDGGLHGFILDTTVHPNYRRKQVALNMLIKATDVARIHGLEWLHVDYAPVYEALYQKAGFRSTAAGILQLADP